MKPHALLRVLLVGLFASAPAFAAAPPLDLEAAQAEVTKSYGKAHPEVQEFVLHTARSFGPSGFWVNENAYAGLTPEQREEKKLISQQRYADVSEEIHAISQLLRAYSLYERDVE